VGVVVRPKAKQVSRAVRVVVAQLALLLPALVVLALNLPFKAMLVERDRQVATAVAVAVLAALVLLHKLQQVA
jgi:hypothetical protein